MKTHCVHGHPYTPENTLWGTKKDGKRWFRCRTCQREQWRKYGEKWTEKRRGNPDEIAKQAEREARRFEKHPERALARRKVNFYVRKGLIVKPDACERCGVTGKRLDGSHDDYSKPLEVEWLCRRCHAAKDRTYQPIDPPAYKQRVSATSSGAER